MQSDTRNVRMNAQKAEERLFLGSSQSMANGDVRYPRPRQFQHQRQRNRDVLTISEYCAISAALYECQPGLRSRHTTRHCQHARYYGTIDPRTIEKRRVERSLQFEIILARAAPTRRRD